MKHSLVPYSLCAFAFLLLTSCQNAPTGVSNTNVSMDKTNTTQNTSVENKNSTVENKNMNAPITMNTNSLTQKNSNTTSSKKEEKSTITEAQGTKKFSGNFFSISYPANFIATPKNTESSQEPVATDEATFRSPDGSVEFFIFSPQWGGSPASYLETRANETLADEKSETTGKDLSKKITTWKTFQAKDGSYMRSLVSIRDQVDTGSELHHVFGFKYKDQASYDKYRNNYLTFKNSLEQFAD